MGTGDDVSAIKTQNEKIQQMLESVTNQVNGLIDQEAVSLRAKLTSENNELKKKVEELKKVLLKCEDVYQSVEPKKGGEAQKEVKEQKPSGKAAKAKPKEKEQKSNKQNQNESDSTPVDVGRLDFRVGKILSAEKHPDADSLYVEKIDTGEEQPRTVVSGLVKHITAAELEGRMVVLLCNLKPAKMRGVASEAMVMCASSPDKVEVLSPPAGSVPGDLVEFEGYTRNPDSVLNPKKKIFETLAPDLKTNSDCVASYKDVPFVVPGKGKVVASSLKNVPVK